MELTKESVASTIIREGKTYKQKLAGTVLLVIYRDREDNELKFLEVEFYPHHYQHLTGVYLTEVDKVTGERVKREHTAKEFYDRCVKPPYITPQEIEYENPSTINLKMEALPYITQITKITKMTGEYDGKFKDNLLCDYVLGGENSCIGVSVNSDNGRYFPRSCLKENIKKITVYTSQVIAIFQKNVNSKEKYIDIKYVAKGINLTKINIPADIEALLSLENYKKV